MKIEHLVLKNLLHNEEYTRSVLPFLKSEYFSDHNDRSIFKFINSFVTEYNKQASVEAIKIMTSESKKIKIEDSEVISNLLDSWTKNEQTDLKFLIKQTESFCKEKSLHNAILDSIKIISDEKDTRDKGSIPEILKEALAITFDPSVGHDFVSDAETRFEFYHKKEERIRFDIQNLNLITGGGIPRKTLNLILGGVNAGKTLMNNYTHIAMTYRSKRNGAAGVVTIYVDGVSKGTTNVTLTNGTQELFIASPAYSGTPWFAGYIYDAKLWGKELTASDVLSEYNSTKTRFGL